MTSPTCKMGQMAMYDFVQGILFYTTFFRVESFDFKNFTSPKGHQPTERSLAYNQPLKS